MNPGVFDVIDMMTGYQPAAALTAAARLGVFDVLTDAPLPADAVAARLGTEPLATRALLDALTGLGLLGTDDGGYTAAPVARRLGRDGDLRLIAEKEAFFAEAWLSLADSVRTGRPRLDPWRSRLAAEPEQVRRFLEALVVLARETGPDLTRLPGVGPGVRIADLGGGLGSYAVPLAAAGAPGTLVHLPNPSYNPNLPVSVTNSRYAYQGFPLFNPNDPDPARRGRVLVDAAGRSYVNPVAQRILREFYPQPNITDPNAVADLLGANYVYYRKTEFADDRWSMRFDHNLTDNHKLFFRYTDQPQFGNRFFRDPVTDGLISDANVSRQALLNWTGTFTPTTVNEFRASYVYGNFGRNFPEPLLNKDYTSEYLNIGGPGVGAVNLLGYGMPRWYDGGAPTGLNGTTSGAGFGTAGFNQPQDVGKNIEHTYNITNDFSTIKGNMTLKMGFAASQLQLNQANLGVGSLAGGRFSWNRETTGEKWCRTVPIGGTIPDCSGNPIGGDKLASFLVGVPTWVQTQTENLSAVYYYRWQNIGAYFQNDWRVSANLTLNLGIRYQYQSPRWEKNNFQGMLNLNRMEPNPFVLRPDGQPHMAPVFEFAGVDGRSRYLTPPQKDVFEPRFGFAWNFMSKTVLRGGAGIFHRTDTRGNVATGFSLNTDYINTLNAGLTPSSATGGGPYSLSNPFPDGVVRPFGNQLGLATNFGAGVSFDNPNRPIPRTRQWSVTLERELPWGMVLEASYVGSRTTQEGRGIQIGDMSQADWDRAQDPANVSFYQTAVPNPFFGLARPGTTMNSQANISRRDLLRAYPGFTSVFDNVNPSGRVWYNALQTRFEKRMLGDRSRTGALTWVTAYTWSKMMENFLRNDYAHAWQEMRNQVTAEDRTHNFTTAAIWDLPFGKNRSYLTNMPKAAEFLAGGWTANFNLIYQSGVPLGAWRSWEFRCGDPRAGIEPNERQWFFNDRTRFSECWRQLRPFEYAQLPNRFHQLRSHTAPQFDVMISKKFQLNERWQVEFRGEAFNAFNTPLRGDPPSTNPAGADFGILPVAQLNFPRNIQLGARIRF